MKKLLVALVAVVFASCSQDQVESSNLLTSESSLSALDGDLLSYKDDASFIKEYSALSEMKSSKEIQGWISKKGFKSLLNTSNDSIYIQNDVLDNKRIIYSDAIKAILNNESKFKINGNVIWANEQNLYLLDENNSNLNNQELINQIKDLKVYGNILNISSYKNNDNSSTTSRVIIPNENKSIDWIVGYNSAGRDRRIILTLFNETIILNNITTSSKMFIRCIRQGKFCSFWTCRWNEEFEPKQLALDIYSLGYATGWDLNPSLYYYNNITYISSNNNTILLATAQLAVPYATPTNFIINATAYVTTLNGGAQIPYNWTQQISWY